MSMGWVGSLFNANGQCRNRGQAKLFDTHYYISSKIRKESIKNNTALRI